MKINLTRLAKRYEKAVDMSDDEYTKDVYALMVQECWEQFKRIPVYIDFVSENPYKTSKELFRVLKRIIKDGK